MVFTLLLLLILLFYFSTVESFGRDSIDNFSYFVTLTGIIIIVNFIKYVDSLLVLLFVLEIYSVYFFFFFILRFTKFNSTNVLKYKNLILMYLWNSFFTTILFGISCIIFMYKYGTLNFSELSMLQLGGTIELYLLLFSFFWKLGIPGFHWFKIEIYKYIGSANIIIYSIITIFSNVILILLLVSKLSIFVFLSTHSFLILILIFGIVLILTQINVQSMLQFIAYSSIITFLVIISLILLKDICKF